MYYNELNKIKRKAAMKSAAEADGAKRWADVYASIGLIEKKKEYVPFLNYVLSSTSDDGVRNEVAILLGDIGDESSIEPLIERIMSPETADHKGSLLYALMSYEPDCYVRYFDLFIELICADNYEVRKNSCMLLEKIIEKIGQNKKSEAVKYIESAMDEMQNRYDDLTYIAELLRKTFSE